MWFFYNSKKNNDITKQLIENINNKCRPFQMAATLLYGDNWIDKVVTKVKLSQRVSITMFLLVPDALRQIKKRNIIINIHSVFLACVALS